MRLQCTTSHIYYRYVPPNRGNHKIADGDVRALHFSNRIKLKDVLSSFRNWEEIILMIYEQSGGGGVGWL